MSCHCDCDSTAHSTSRRAAMGGALGMGLLAGLPLTAMAQSTTQVRKEIPSPDEAIQMLMAGNKRFIDGDMLPHDHITTRQKLNDGQMPIATVLRCSDFFQLTAVLLHAFATSERMHRERSIPQSQEKKVANQQREPKQDSK